ncbi:SDR family NAD(P)-dependent oxidoreductase [Streptomyces sp. NPDC093984]|uniref:SDR family NAD(P)-dependent oxidoreductase n=1 Tax=Streptomyces sp. NPDC093984 TaxID=3366052 RepID=UPI003817D61A
MGLLDGKVALITGGTSGIGRAAAFLFAQEGARVAFTGRRERAGKEVMDGIVNNGGEALFIKADATDIKGAADVVEQVVNRFGRLDVAFNNAGTAAVGPITELDEAAWHHLVDGNLKGSFFYLQAEVAQLKRQGDGGAIVFNGSVFAELGTHGISVYSATKGGVAALARAAAVELGPDGIRVNTVNPTIIRTPLTESGITKNNDGSEYHPHGEKIPLGRIGEAEEVAQVALFLLSDRASFVTGQAVMVDGGQSVN